MIEEQAGEGDLMTRCTEFQTRLEYTYSTLLHDSRSPVSLPFSFEDPLPSARSSSHSDAPG